jgi:hypothetical protein
MLRQHQSVKKQTKNQQQQQQPQHQQQHRSVVTLARIDVLPDDGPVGPKHVGVINFNVLISVKNFKVWKILQQKDSSANSWFNNLYIQVYCTV